MATIHRMPTAADTTEEEIWAEVVFTLLEAERVFLMRLVLANAVKFWF